MTHLVLVGDASDPPDVTKLPTDMVAVCGYVGGDTPHVWGRQEIVSVLNTGRMWWPIYTAPSRGQHLTAMMGERDGLATVEALRPLPVAKVMPVFCDIEHDTFVADPAGAIRYLSNWKHILRGAGWRGYGYLPWSTQQDWVADWTNIRPTSLPDQVVGWQYGGVPGLDYSVFDLDKLGVPHMTVPTGAQNVSISSISPEAAHAIALGVVRVELATVNGFNGSLADVATGDHLYLSQLVGLMTDVSTKLDSVLAHLPAS